MPASPSLARRAGALTRHVTVSDRLFATGDDKRFAATLDEGLERVEQRLVAETVFADRLADASARYLLEAGGKRVRPALTLLTAQLGDGNTDSVIAAAAAVEITHLASLYHDDVMDDAHMRRGVPSAQSVWGNSVAVLTGDLLFARASKLVASLGQKAIELQADTFERLCLGQLHETLGPQAGEDALEHYLQVLADKTGSLIAAAAEMGVVFSGAPDEFRSPVLEFGEKIGVAFQLVDDVLDLAAPDDSGESETGKTQGTDLRAGVVTLPLLQLRALAATDAASAVLLRRLEAEVVGRDGSGASALVDELRRHEATRRAIAEARRWGREAVEALAPLPAGPVRKALTRFAETVVERSA